MHTFLTSMDFLSSINFFFPSSFPLLLRTLFVLCLQPYGRAMEARGLSHCKPSSATGLVSDIPSDHGTISSEAINAEMGIDLQPLQPRPDQKNNSPVKLSKTTKLDTGVGHNGGLEFSFVPLAQSVLPSKLKQPALQNVLSSRECEKRATPEDRGKVTPPPANENPQSVKIAHNCPTEEDLLLLLMRHNRLRLTAQHQSFTHQSQLEKQNKTLRSQNSILQDQKRILLQESEAVKEENEHLTQRLNEFQEKYQKLKKWAFEFNIENSTLREDANRIKADLDSTKLEGESLKVTTDELRLSLEKTRNAVKECRQHLTQTLSDTTSISQKLQHCNELLQRERTLRLEEKAQNERYASYIARLENAQNVSNQNVNQQQQDIIERLRKILNSVEHADKTDVTEILQAYALKNESLNKQDLIHASHVKEVCATIKNFGDEFTRVHKSIAELQHISNAIRPAAYASEFQMLQGRFDELMSNIEKCEAIQIKAKEELEERLKAAERRCQSLERDKMSAQLLSTGLIEVQKSFINFERNDKHIKLKQPRAIDSGTRLLQHMPNDPNAVAIPNSQPDGGHPVTHEEMLLHSEPNDNLVPHKSPIRLRSGSQIRTATPRRDIASVIVDTTTTTPGGRPMPQHRCNSAVKRCEHREGRDEHVSVKKPRRTPKSSQHQSDKYRLQFGMT